MLKPQKYKIIIVDDHALFREGIKLLIEHEKIGEVIAELENGKKFLDFIADEKPDIVLMDIDMPIMNGIEATQKALELYPDLNILVLSMHGDQNHYNQLISAGAKGFVLKTSGKQELQNAITTVSQGDSYFSSELLRKIIVDITRPKENDKSNKPNIDFTERELEILGHFCGGYTVSEIAEKMFLSVKTIEAYRSKLLQKTGVKNTICLVLFAIKNKIVSL